MLKFLKNLLSQGMKVQPEKPEGKVVIDTLDAAYDYFLRQGKGFLSDFEMDQVLFADFCNVGYIRQGMNGSMQERWQITDFGKSQFRSYLALSEQKEKSERFIATLAI